MVRTTVNLGEIDVCLIVFNEELFLEKCLLRLAPYFQRIYVLDMGSTDRTIDIIRDIYGDRAEIVVQPRSDLFENGFAHARNRVTQAATRSWVLHIDADELLAPLDADVISFESAPDAAAAAKILRHNLIGEIPADYEPETLRGMAKSSTEHQVRLFKKQPDVRWESFLHEEIWIGDRRAHEIVGASNLVVDHLSAFRPHADRDEKELFYAWILMRVHDNPDLQRYMREFYTQEYIPHNLERFRAMAKIFAEKKGI
ncbi:glycosyltransferase [Methylosinus sp. R-45379]|uniref:glycosyltransferase n=1 Tax=Methylosinus sp. R-45379 TaxID=980563 RepID=UPI000A01C25D|nr:glycosyltransferase [Methylosinus sp. R-45379]